MQVYGNSKKHKPMIERTRSDVEKLMAKTGHGITQAIFVDFARTHQNMMFPVFDLQRRVRGTLAHCHTHKHSHTHKHIHTLAHTHKIHTRNHRVVCVRVLVQMREKAGGVSFWDDHTSNRDSSMPAGQPTIVMTRVKEADGVCAPVCVCMCVLDACL